MKFLDHEEMYTLVTSETQCEFENRDDALQALLDVIKVDGVYDFTQNEKYVTSRVEHDTSDVTEVFSCRGGNFEKSRETYWKKDTTWKVFSISRQTTEKLTYREKAVERFKDSYYDENTEDLICEYLSEVGDADDYEEYYDEITVETPEFKTWQVQYQTYLNTHYPKKWVPFPPGVGATCPVEFW